MLRDVTKSTVQGVITDLFGSVWSISSIFAASEPGWLYDNSDMSTLFQDAAGTTPVTAVGQPVGLQFDKSKGLVLGPELVTNGDFSAGSTGWNLVGTGWSIASGLLSGSAVPANDYGPHQKATSVVAGVTYKATYTITVTTGGVAVRVGNTQSSTYTSSGTYTQYLVATSTGVTVFQLRAGGSGFTGTIDNISVKELAGTHRTQSTAASRPTFARLPVTGRRNLLTYTEDFGNAAWVSSHMSISPNDAIAPDGSATADKVVATATTGYHYNYQSYTTLAANYTVSVYAKAAEYSKIKVSDVALGAFAAQFDLTGGTLIAQTAGTSASITRDPATGWCRCSVTFTATAAFRAISFAGYPDSGVTQTNFGVQYTGDDTSGIYLWGAQLELGSTATNYQAVTSLYDITEAGVQTAYGLYYDGVDDFLVTPTITPGTDKVQVFAGVRKLSDALIGIVAETSVSIGGNNGSLQLAAPFSGANYTFQSRGTTQQAASYTDVSIAAPVTNVVTGVGDISSDISALRVNGIQVAQSTADQGTGNYLAYPAYFGRRGGTTLPFNGYTFREIGRFGPNLDTATIANVENWINQNTGAY